MCRGFENYVSITLRCSEDIFFKMCCEFTRDPTLKYSKIFRAVAGFAVWVYMTNSL